MERDTGDGGGVGDSGGSEDEPGGGAGGDTGLVPFSLEDVTTIEPSETLSASSSPFRCGYEAGMLVLLSPYQVDIHSRELMFASLVEGVAMAMGESWPACCPCVHWKNCWTDGACLPLVATLYLRVAERSF